MAYKVFYGVAIIWCFVCHFLLIERCASFSQAASKLNSLNLDIQTAERKHELIQPV